jgi:APA family basic amino acid/polyamine antiporter
MNDATKPELPRVLGAASAASILIGAIIGSGIFKKPSTVAGSLPSPGWILVCWIVAGALALIGSLVFAELGSRYPGAGGQFTFIRKSFGDFAAFLFGWTNLIIINSASMAALAVVSGEFAFNLLPEPLRPAPGSHWHKSVPALLIIALTIVNARGVWLGATVQNVLTVLKLAALGLLIAGIGAPSTADWSHFSPFWEIRGSPSQEAVWGGFKAAFLAIFWAYDGWYQLSFSGGEIRNPQRNIPLGFVAGILVVIIVYALANVAYLAVVSLEEMKDVTLPGGVASEAAFRLYGPIGLAIISLGIVFSTLGAANANVLTGPRLSYAMARDGLFFKPFAMLHRQYLTPLPAIALQGVLGVIYVYAGSFDQLTDSVVFAAWIFYLLTVLGYIVLRRRAPSADGGFRAPGFPLLPALFVLFAAAFVVYSFADSALKSWTFVQALRHRQPGDAPLKQKVLDGIYPMVSSFLIVLGIPLFAVLRRLYPGGVNAPER